ncbi:MAG: hypothetical protein JSR55_03425, partial [Proteobacteria bacterium]|nr:hypothetical protein [Pseudomonadota bacterium]
VLLIVGIVALVLGLFWAGQGYGLIQWPPHAAGQFTMVGVPDWTYRGIALAVVGALIILWSRRR